MLTIFLYHALKDPHYLDACKAFLKGMEAGEIQGFTSVIVLNEIVLPTNKSNL
jgi:predicted nucleic acid-binding protein